MEVTIFKRKGDMRNCSCYGALKLHELRLKVVERVLEKRPCRNVTTNEMRFSSMPEKGTINAEGCKKAERRVS